MDASALDAGWHLAALDWVFLALVLGSLLVGAWRGLVFELISLAGWAAAFVVAQWLASDVGAWLPMGDTQGPFRHAAGFVLVFVGALFFFGFVAWLSKKLVEAVGLRPTDRVLGALFGAVRGALLLLALALVASWTPLHEAPWWKTSVAAPMLHKALVQLKPAVPEEFARHMPS